MTDDPTSDATGWTRLSALARQPLFRGTVFRLPADHPYEGVVDYMLILGHPLASDGLSVLVTTGNKAGLVSLLCGFPDEAYVDGAVAICSDWLQANWSAYMWPSCAPDDVYVRKGYPADPGAFPPSLSPVAAPR